MTAGHKRKPSEQAHTFRDLTTKDQNHKRTVTGREVREDGRKLEGPQLVADQSTEKIILGADLATVDNQMSTNSSQQNMVACSEKQSTTPFSDLGTGLNDPSEAQTQANDPDLEMIWPDQIQSFDGTVTLTLVEEHVGGASAGYGRHAGDWLVTEVDRQELVEVPVPGSQKTRWVYEPFSDFSDEGE